MDTIRSKEQREADNLEMTKMARTKLTDAHGAKGVATVPVEFNVILEVGKVERSKSESVYSIQFMESKRRQLVFKATGDLEASLAENLELQERSFITQTSEFYPKVKLAITSSVVDAIKEDLAKRYPKLELVEIITDPVFVARVKDDKHYYTVPYRFNVAKGTSKCFAFNISYERKSLVRFNGFYEPSEFPSNDAIIARLKACVDYELQHGLKEFEIDIPTAREQLYLAIEEAVTGKEISGDVVKAVYQKL